MTLPMGFIGMKAYGSSTTSDTGAEYDYERRGRSPSAVLLKPVTGAFQPDFLDSAPPRSSSTRYTMYSIQLCPVVEDSILLS